MSTHCSDGFQVLLEGYGMRCSMSRKATSLSACVSPAERRHASGDAKHTVVIVQTTSDIEAKPFAHPGLLHGEGRFQRMQVNVVQRKQPWPHIAGQAVLFAKLVAGLAR